MKKKQTRRALLMSVLSLLLCCSMLVGTTFAWFTDSVTSGKNQIVAGNLDVELRYGKVVDGQVTAFDTVQSKDDLFDKNALWEPGHVEVVYLEVSNQGSLALKYQLGVNVHKETIGKTKDGADIKLSDHLVFKTVLLDNASQIGMFNNRELAKEKAGTEKGLKDYNGKVTPLEVGGAHYVALIVYMPESVGNEANHDGTNIPKIEMGVTLFATQQMAEEDSFGKDYDEDAKYDSNAVVNGNATESTKLSTENTQVEIPAGAEGGTYVLNTSEITTTEKDGVVTATMDITLLRNGEKATTTAEPFKVIVNIGAGLNLTKVLHNDVELTGYTYDIATGDLTFETTHFSPFAFVYDNGADVATLDELLAALATDTRVINLKNDIEASEVVLIGRSVMINGNGYKVTSNATRVFRVTTNDVDVILNDVNMVSTAVRVGSNDVRGISIDVVENVKLTLNNCTVDFTDASANDWAYAVNVTGGANHTVTVNGGAYEGANVINVRSAKSAVTVKNATLTSTLPNTEANIAQNNFGACIWVLKNQGTSVYASGNTYIGDNAVAHNLGVGNFLEEGDNVDNATTLAVEARIGGAIYDTLAKAVAAANAGETIVLVNDATINNVIKIDKNITIKLSGSDLIAETGSRPFHVYGADLTIDATGSNVELDKYGLVDIKEGDVKITIIGGTFTGELDNGAVIKARKNANAEIYLENLNMTFTDISAKGSYVYNPESGASAITVIEGGVYNVDCGFTGNVTMKNATVNAKGFIFNGGGSIENCTLTTDGSSKAPAAAAPFCCVAASNDREVTVTNSTLTATNCNAIEIYPTGGIVTVTGSTVNGACYKHPLYDAQDSCSITIDGVEQ